MNEETRTLLVQLGKAQMDALSERQDKGPAIDDGYSEKK
jgi:hypothetical protein